MRLLSGRLPTDSDRTSARAVAVISQQAATRLFPTGPVLGRQVKLRSERLEVVGVVADIRSDGPLRHVEPTVYQIYQPEVDPFKALTIVVRPSGNARALPALLRQAATSIGPPVLVGPVRRGTDWLGDRIATPRQRTVLLGLLGALGVVLALVGVFGVTAYAVARRTQEIGVRMAFGARPGQVVLTVLRDMVLPTSLGLLAGLARGAPRRIASFLFETTATDPATFAAVAIALGLAAVVAAWLPARRAARVNPVEALRAE